MDKTNFDKNKKYDANKDLNKNKGTAGTTTGTAGSGFKGGTSKTGHIDRTNLDK